MAVLGITWPPPADIAQNIVSKDLEDRLQVAIECAQQSAKIIQAAGTGGRSAIAKDGVDLVTQTDTASENNIKKIISEKFPTDDFIGEESFDQTGDFKLSDNYTWVIDPIDGTTNFVHDFPFYSVSIALAYKKTFVIGVIIDPATNDLYSAVLGGGAYYNGEKMKVRSAKSLGEALVNNNIGKSRDEAFRKKTLSRLGGLMQEGVRGLRNVGGAAMAMALVARGTFDAFFEDGFGGPWDIAAGAVLIKEAGGVCWDIHGQPMEVMQGAGRIVCGGERVCELLTDVFKRVDAEISN